MTTAPNTYSTRVRRLAATFLAITWLLLGCFTVPCPAKQIEEYHVKAVFLFNLAHFVTWPIDPSPTAPSFSIGIYGEDPFGQVLDNVIKGETKFDKPITIKRYTNLQELQKDPCNILFVSAGAMNQWETIRDLPTASAILTVSDVAGFPEKGGMVNLLKAEQRIQVEINRAAVSQAGLVMSAKLLILARLVP